MNYVTISNYGFTDDEVAEVNDGTLITNITGYIDPVTQITNMLLAGETLDQIRQGTYEYDNVDEDGNPITDNDPDSDDYQSDPTRSTDYDLLDVRREMDRYQLALRKAAVIGGKNVGRNVDVQSDNTDGGSKAGSGSVDTDPAQNPPGGIQ